MPTDEIAIRVSREFKPYAGLHGVLMGALVIRMGPSLERGSVRRNRSLRIPIV
jgi:hypothetical protein